MLNRLFLFLALVLPFIAPLYADTLRFGEKNWQELTLILSNSKISPHWRDEHGHLAAYLHLNYGSELAALSYLQRVESNITRRKYAEELLPSAVYRGSEFMTRALLKMGASPNPSSKGFYSPLMIAASDKKLEIMRILLNAGADPYFLASDNDTLSIILSNGQDYAMKLLFDRDFSLHKYRGDTNKLLFLAVLGNSEFLVRRLIESGLPIDRRNNEGDTLLTFAVKNGAKEDVLRILILNGSNQCEADRDGLFPFQIVEEKNKLLQRWDWKYEDIFLEKCIN